VTDNTANLQVAVEQRSGGARTTQETDRHSGEMKVLHASRVNHMSLLLSPRSLGVAEAGPPPQTAGWNTAGLPARFIGRVGVRSVPFAPLRNVSECTARDLHAFDSLKEASTHVHSGVGAQRGCHWRRAPRATGTAA
jgi:hypothetical protein